MTGPKGRNQDRPFAVQRLLEQMRFHGVRRRRAPDEAYRRRGPSVRQGKLCARGYGYSQIAYSKDRLTDPLKKNDKGAFEAISWDQAYSEIAEKVKAIIADKGPQRLPWCRIRVRRASTTRSAS